MPGKAGGIAHKRTRLQREADRVEVVRLVRRGWSLQRIASCIGDKYDGGLSRQQILNDYRYVLREMSDDYRSNRKYCRVLALQQTEEIKEEARKAWDYANNRFLEHVIYQILTQKDEAAERGEAPPSQFEISIKGMPENNYLLTILKALGIEMEIHGLKSKKKVDKRTINFNWDVLSGNTPSALVDDIEAQIEALTPQNIQHLVPPQTTNGAATGTQPTNGEQRDRKEDHT